MDDAVDWYRQALDSRPSVVEFTGKALAEVQALANQLRDTIFTAEIDDQHRYRLLKKVGALQLELHRRMRRIDEFICLAGSVAVAIQLFGESAPNIKKLTERIMAMMMRALAVPTAETFGQLFGVAPTLAPADEIDGVDRRADRNAA